MTEAYPRVDLTNCDREPIHILGAIQPIGFLIALTAEWTVCRVSANAGLFLGGAAEALIGEPITALLPSSSVHTLRNRAVLLREPDSFERMLGAEFIGVEGKFDIALHLSRNEIVLESERSRADNPGDPANIVRAMIARLDRTDGVADFLTEGARQVRMLTGFDRVMVYRFGDDGAGEVVAEAARPGIGSFLGLHYPASDIPAQARALYKRNLLRIISDVDAQPVPIAPLLDAGEAPLDLSLSTLRAVSPIHIEYLRNMGVKASMSISIIVDGQLWGLFACHHYAPRCPSLDRRSIAELFAQMFAMRLESRERKDRFEFERRARQISDQLLGAVASDHGLLRDTDWVRGIVSHAIPADGIGICLKGERALSGLTPPEKDFLSLLSALNGMGTGKVVAADRMASVLPKTEAYASSAAGFLAIPLSRVPRDYLVLFRSEMERSVRWAGDPHKPAEPGPHGLRLTPRKSFEEWKELVKGRSRPFTGAELSVAETLRIALTEVVLRLTEEVDAERQQANERQELLIAELNHRVRNILGLIRGLIRQSRPDESASLDEFISMLDGRIQALARAHNQVTQNQGVPASLRSLIEAETNAFLTDQKDRVSAEGPPVLLSAHAYPILALVLHELVTNSVKYGALSASGRVTVIWTVEENGNLDVEWRERGGPAVSAPTRRGFGTTIIERSIPHDLGGEAQITYKLPGVEASFCVPARHISTPEGAAAASGPVRRIEETQAAGAVRGRNVLLVEDSLIIALDAEDVLMRLGAAQVTTAGTVEVAFSALERDAPTLAVLDVNLGGETSFTVADRLDALGIPFLFATGYGEDTPLPKEHIGRIVVQKPYSFETLAGALAKLGS